MKCFVLSDDTLNELESCEFMIEYLNRYSDIESEIFELQEFWKQYKQLFAR